MANITDYVRYYRNKNFEEVPFNEVDALILANLSYLNFDRCKNICPRTIEDLSEEYFRKVTPEKIKKEFRIYRDSHNLLNVMKSTIRYKDLVITDYQKYVAKEVQFGAITIRGKDFVYISFEGTNSFISGWKEDCHLSHRFPTQSQLLAKEYIARNVKLTDKNVYIGGHSKGANLAVVGAMQSSIHIQKKITAVYAFDGPGVREKEFKTEQYKRIEPKIKKYVPNNSIVGVLMYNPEKFKTINSNAKAIKQHNPFTWPCFGGFFIEDSLSRKSTKFAKEIKKFVTDYNEEELEAFIEDLFEILKTSDVKQTDMITPSTLIKCLKHYKDLNLEPKSKEKINVLFNMLIELYK